MSGHLMSENYRCTVFINNDFTKVLSDVLDWLHKTTPSGRTNDFYFVDMTYSYDGESGSVITVWHGELK